MNFVAEPGQTIAIVGPTGAGKTTISNLIPRFYDVTAGAVKIDGIDVRDVTAASLRAQIGIVLQDPFLFSDTMMANIRYGKAGRDRRRGDRGGQACARGHVHRPFAGGL